MKNINNAAGVNSKVLAFAPSAQGKKRLSPELAFANHLARSGEYALGERAANGAVDTTVYRWNGSIWEMQPDYDMRASALRWLHAHHSEQANDRLAQSCVRTAVLHLGRTVPSARDRALIPLSNCYLEILPSGQIRAHTPDPEFGATFALPAMLDLAQVDAAGHYVPPPVNPASRWGQYLRRFLPDPDVRGLLQEATASSFLTRCYEKGFFLVGTGSNGKSTYLHVLRALHPSSSAVRVETLGNTFALGPILGKTAIFATEMPKQLSPANQEVLKAIISRDPMQVEFKGRDAFTAVPRCTFFGSLNSWFSVSGHEHGFWRKVCAIPFTVQLAEGDPDRIPDFHLHITEDPKEMGEVINWILEGAVRLVQRGRFPELPKAVAELARQNRLSSDTVAAYLEDREAVVDGHVATNKLSIYQDYREFVEQEAGKKPVSAEEFWKRVREMSPDLDFQHLTVQGKKVRVATLRVPSITPVRDSTPAQPPLHMDDVPY